MSISSNPASSELLLYIESLKKDPSLGMLEIAQKCISEYSSQYPEYSLNDWRLLINSVEVDTPAIGEDVVKKTSYEPFEKFAVNDIKENVYSSLKHYNEDIQLEFQIEYLKILRSNANLRPILRDLFPTELRLYRFIKDSPEKASILFHGELLNLYVVLLLNISNSLKALTGTTEIVKMIENAIEYTSSKKKQNAKNSKLERNILEEFPFLKEDELLFSSNFIMKYKHAPHLYFLNQYCKSIDYINYPCLSSFLKIQNESEYRLFLKREQDFVPYMDILQKEYTRIFNNVFYASCDWNFYKCYRQEFIKVTSYLIKSLNEGDISIQLFSFIIKNHFNRNLLVVDNNFYIVDLSDSEVNSMYSNLDSINREYKETNTTKLLTVGRWGPKSNHKQVYLKILRQLVCDIYNHSKIKDNNTIELIKFDKVNLVIDFDILYDEPYYDDFINNKIIPVGSRSIFAKYIKK